MNSKITYHQQVSYCGKPRCRKCREGAGHGPYWYAYQTVNGRTTRSYVGKHLPADVLAAQEAAKAQASSPTSPLVDLSAVSLRIHTLGQFRLERRGELPGQTWQTVTDALWQQRKVRALLAYLIASPGRRLSRAQATAALWPESSKEAAAGNLNKIVHHLRQLLEPSRNQPGGPRSSSFFLRSEGEWLVLAEQSHIWIDADAFESLLAQTMMGAPPEPAASEEERQDIPAGDSSASWREGLLQEAVTLYGGEFLPEERQAEWVSARRQRLRRSWISLLLALADLAMEQEQPGRALEVLDRLLANDPVNEAAVQRLIVVLAQSKRRAEALRAYHRLADALWREYQTTPLEATKQLYETVRSGEAPSKPLVTGPLADEAAAGSVSTQGAQGPTQGTLKAQTVQIGRVHQSPLVGRNRELTAMRTMLSEVEEGTQHLLGQRRLSGIPLDTQRRPQCLVLMGEAGIGKTRLAEEMSREARRRGWSVIWSRIYEQESGIPYRIWTEALRKVIQLGQWPQPVGASGRAASLPLAASQAPFAGALQPLSALLPELEEVLPGVAQRGYADADLPVQPEQEQLRLREAASTLLATVSENTPLLIVLDDIQWADGSSDELLGYLARTLYGYPIVFVATCRETELSHQPPHPLRMLFSHMQREHSVELVHVEPLTPEQIGQLVSHLPESMVQHIQAQAAGNPFFAEELARTAPPALPKTVAAALDHRMSRLSADCQHLLGNAAVLGGSFEFSVISAMEASTSLSDEDTMLTLLEEALQAGVLTEEGTGTRITYHFWHPLLVSHLYERVSAARRARLHLRAADVLRRMYQGREEEVAAMITHHLVRAGAEPFQIARYAEIAGNRAYALLAYAEAERHYWIAAEHRDPAIRTHMQQVDASPELPSTNILVPSSSEHLDEQLHTAQLLERLAECTMIRGNFEEARRLYHYVLSLRASRVHMLRKTQDAAWREASAQYEGQIQALLWGEIGRLWRYTGENTRALRCYERGEQVLDEVHVVGGLAWAKLRYQESGHYWQEGRYDEARQMAQEALTLFRQQPRLPKEAQEPTSAALTTRIQRTLAGDPADLGRSYGLLGLIANHMGLRSKALTYFQTALTVYEQYDYKREIAHVSCNLGNIHLKKAEYKLAQAALRRSLNLASRLGDEPLSSVVFSNLGELAACFGDLEEAEMWYKKGLKLAERFNDRVYMSAWNAGLATVLQEEKKMEEAAACIVQSLRVGRAMKNDPCIGVALVALGSMRITQALALDQHSTRERLLTRAQQAIQRALALNALEAETRTKGQLAEAHLSLLLGDSEKARQKLKQVIGEAHRYELALVEAHACRLLDTLSEVPTGRS